MSELWDFIRINVTQNSLQELKEADLVPTVEEYTTLLRCPRIQADKAYSKAANILTFLKKLMSITGINMKKRVNVFVLSIYGLVIFPKALEHIDEVEKVSDRVFCENYSPLKEFVTTQGEKTFLKKTGWQFTRVSKTKTMNEVPLG
ncbi:hypothetical protein Goarm_017508 [Gossypium armourianum]|uniref:Uncharacterized protein n=1 Tax=Gossypium armourianum TaxID=34283 RepID=A0A7J9JFY4_9ROSI|nr:hypothetical protein [Gossypium armourianum]